MATESATDLFADALYEFYDTGHSVLYTQRDDGYRVREDISWYFTSYKDFPLFEKQALRSARGRVLDIGCGTGRHSRYLQRRGFDVVGIDTSARIVELARLSGLRDVRVANACNRLAFNTGEFDTIVLFGNNLGICGTLRRFRRMLRQLYRVTTSHACILATTRTLGANSRDRRYTSQNVAYGRAAGQVHLRLERRGNYSPWFYLLLFDPAELQLLAEQEGWSLEQLFTKSVEDGYSAVLRKKPR